VPIRIVTDSTCDLPAEMIAQYGIGVVPLYINIAGKSYLEGVDLTREKFYRDLPKYHPVPTTAAAAPARFREVYEALAQQGASEILSIHISVSLSAVVDTARLAAQETKSIEVTVFDSRQLSLGTGFLVETAAKAAAAGCSMGEILTLLEEQLTRSHVFVALDTLEFLKRSGRMNGAVSAMGNLLQVKPLLRMFDGKATAERVRTREQATLRLLEILHAVGPLERAAMLHTDALGRIAELRERAEHLLPPGDILAMNITPVIGAHIGPGAVGFAVVSK
jgi:DegV family protein with EDD domain